MSELREQIQRFLEYSATNRPVDYAIKETVQENGYSRQRIESLSNEGDVIPAYLLIPDGGAVCPAVLLQHQHHSQRHLGKSEAVGLASDPLQNFGGELVKRGFIVLAPDSICFEDRRHNTSGIEEHPEDGQQHYNEMCYRLIQGDTLMRKVLDDASVGLSLLSHHPQVDNTRIGTIGHSYGGNTVLFHTAVDERIQFCCSSGALCSYQHKMAEGISLEMALVIPKFAEKWDLHHLVACITPRILLVVSADEDIYSQDADKVIERAIAENGEIENLRHHRYQGGHAVTQERFDEMIDWVVKITPP